jgi:hypothetical protein
MKKTEGIQGFSSKGGKARANVLTSGERQEIARSGAAARWRKEKGENYRPPEVIPSGEVTQPAAAPQKKQSDMPFSMFRGILNFGGVELECHVLSDERRVLTQREVVRALSGGRESGNLSRYLDRNPLTAKDFHLGPIDFRIPPGGSFTALGYEATQLIEICEKYLEARQRKLLRGSQARLAIQAEIVIRACAKVGIIALVDEATGFQGFRAKKALTLKLQAFIADEMQDWARMFPPEFWLELARLEGIHYSPRARPLRWGKYIMMFVYDAIDGDVGKELRKKNPNPHFLSNHHMWLKKFGRARVHDQVERVITVMKLCENMDDFRAKFARVFRKSPTKIDFVFEGDTTS